MKSIEEITSKQLENIKLLCFDCDGVLTKKGTEITESGMEFSIKTNPPAPDLFFKLARLQAKYHICVNSGRNSIFLTKLFQPLLWQNISFISEIGIFVLYRGVLFQTGIVDSYELETIKKIRQNLSKLIGDPRVKGFEPKQFLTTLHCHSVVPEVEAVVKQNDSENRFYCWWNEEAYDINPVKFNKGIGINYLLNLLNYSPEQVLTVGNGINDNNMTGVKSLNISTNPQHLQTDDYFVEGEEIGGQKIIDHLLKL
jgi:hydroxymethylpyrimidine pyrophosphatase-like HAD family hydrolase